MDTQKVLDELRSLNQNNMGSWPFWAHAGAVAILAAFILGLGTWYMVLPKGEALEQARKQEQTLRAEFERKQKKVANLDAYKVQLAAMEETFGALLRQLPSQTEVPKLLNDISQTRIASGLEEELFKPKPEVQRDFYAQLPNDLVITGKYHELGTFVSGVAALPRIVTLDGVTINRISKDNGFSGDLRMTVEANTYRYLDAGVTGEDKKK